jgi:hypothetical protein
LARNRRDRNHSGNRPGILQTFPYPGSIVRFALRLVTPPAANPLRPVWFILPQVGLGGGFR